MSVSPAAANVGGDVTFSWQANPPGDYVISYRLYYGAYSRFDSGGALKSNFSYDHFIDFAESQHCDVYGNVTSCSILRADELQCENLYASVPRCTLFGLQGNLYFALTAYNAQSESNFTPELFLAINPQGTATVQQIITLLLLKKK